MSSAVLECERAEGVGEARVGGSAPPTFGWRGLASLSRPHPPARTGHRSGLWIGLARPSPHAHLPSVMDTLQHQLEAGLAGRYHIERALGQGGMAVVFLAQDLRHDRTVALKVLRPDLSAAIGAERFLREIKLAAGLNDSLKTCRSMVSNYKALLEADRKNPDAEIEVDEANPTES